MKTHAIIYSPLARQPDERCKHCVFDDGATCKADLELIRFCTPRFGTAYPAGKLYVEWADIEFAIRKVKEIVSATC